MVVIHLDFYYVACTYTGHRSENKAFGGRKELGYVQEPHGEFCLCFLRWLFFFMYGGFFSLAYANVFGVGFSHA